MHFQFVFEIVRSYGTHVVDAVDDLDSFPVGHVVAVDTQEQRRGFYIRK